MSSFRSGITFNLDVKVKNDAQSAAPRQTSWSFVQLCLVSKTSSDGSDLRW